MSGEQLSFTLHSLSLTRAPHGRVGVLEGPKRKGLLSDRRGLCHAATCAETTACYKVDALGTGFGF